MFNNGGPSLSDIAAATGGNRNDGFGEGGGIWVLIILFALFGGFGNGNNARNGGGETVVVPVPTYGGWGHGGGWGSYDAASMQRGFDTQNTINQAAQAIMQNDNANYRQLNDTIRDGFCNLKMEQKDQQIAQLTAALSDCNAAKLAQQTATQVVNQIRPQAVPAYPASNPCGMGNWSPQVLTGGSYNNGFGCCNMSTAA